MDYLNFSERPENLFVRILMVIFGILCLFTSGWWAVYLLKTPNNDKSFWVATLFLFLFGVYQIYAGLGYARRYIKIDGANIEIKQNAFTRASRFNHGMVETVEVRSADILFRLTGAKEYRLKIGIRYPELGEKIRKMVISFAEKNSITLEFNNG